MGAVAAALTIADPTHAETMNEAESTEKQGGAAVKPGMVFGRLTVLEALPPTEITTNKKRCRGVANARQRQWSCQCSCGKAVTLCERNLREGSKSCGCIRIEMLTERATKHGFFGRPEYFVWQEMVKRCNNPNSQRYARYGARGIKVCPHWEESIENFMTDMGPRPSAKHSIERVDNDGNYEPGNCVWATNTQQARNRCTNRLITAFGETLCVSEWVDRYGISANMIVWRINKKGWDAERALTTPVRPRKKSVSYCVDDY